MCKHDSDAHVARSARIIASAVRCLRGVLKLLVIALVLRVTSAVVLNYQSYFPPDFESEFLIGRRPYFFGSYQWAFYVHLLSGPISLLLGLLLLSSRVRQCWPRWHRRLGKLQCGLVLFCVAPSGLWMAVYADAGPVAETGFAVLAVTTGIAVSIGWRAAVQKRFGDHARWMIRCCLLLSSAVVLRIIGGIAVSLKLDTTWTYPMSAWMSWLLPLAAFEFSTRRRNGVENGQEM